MTSTSLEKTAPKLKVFISYSRRDLRFAEKLVSALESRDIEAVIDKRDLPLAEEWQKEILSFIRQADSVVYIVSAASIGSKWCSWEIEQVQKLSKRLAPVVVGEVDDNLDVPEGIRKVNYVFFTGEYAEGPGFERQIDALAKAPKTEIAWIKNHTRLGGLAARWEERKRSAALLLRGGELDEAEAWSARQPLEAPGLTLLHREFIAVSRVAATRRQRMWFGGSLAAVAVAMTLTGIAWSQRQKAVTENNRFETYFELISQERTFSIKEVSKVEDPVALAQRALRAGRNIARRDIRGVTIVWVDDKPRNNEKEKAIFRDLMKRLGVSFIDAASVTEAEAQIANKKVDLVISDFNHDRDTHAQKPAAFRLLDILKTDQPGGAIPLIIYSVGFSPEQADSAKCQGAVAETDNRATLFGWVLIALDAGRDYKPSQEIETLCNQKTQRGVGSSPPRVRPLAPFGR